MQLSQLDQTLYTKLYQDINEFRTTFDLPVASPESLNDQADTLHSSLIIEELTELAQADSKVEKADAIVDSVYVLMGRQVHLGAMQVQDNLSISYFVDVLLNTAKNIGFDFVTCWNEVHSSNMSKVCRNQQEMDDTIAHYAKQGVEIAPSQQGQYLIAKCAKDVEMDGKTVRQGKVLKSVNYRPANLAALI